MTRDKHLDVLLVEDDDRLRAVLARSLALQGYAVIEAASVLDAKELLERSRVDSAIIDINLPDATGWDLVRWIRSREDISPKLIVISAAPIAQQRINELRPDASLTKPFPIDALLRHLTNGARLLRAAPEGYGM